jgi:hypothetical protein
MLISRQFLDLFSAQICNGLNVSSIHDIQQYPIAFLPRKDFKYPLFSIYVEYFVLRIRGFLMHTHTHTHKYTHTPREVF